MDSSKIHEEIIQQMTAKMISLVQESDEPKFHLIMVRDVIKDQMSMISKFMRLIEPMPDHLKEIVFKKVHLDIEDIMVTGFCTKVIIELLNLQIEKGNLDPSSDIFKDQVIHGIQVTAEEFKVFQKNRAQGRT